MSEPATAGVEWEYAAFGDRLCADFVDGVIALAMALPVYFLIDRHLLGLETGLLDGGADYGFSDLVLSFCFLFNMTYLVGKRGQSWGRQFWGIKVVDRAGEPIGFFRALFRNVFAMSVSALPLYLGFFWVIWDGHKQAWHDKVFRTFVLKRKAR
jgi:uncharacterized RDD family membrane protein YckC